MTFYKVYLSVSKVDIELDQEDYDKLSANISGGNLIKVKQAIINPSFVVAIVPFEKDVQKKITGHIENGVYVIDSETEKIPEVPDAFTNKLKNYDSNTSRADRTLPSA